MEFQLRQVPPPEVAPVQDEAEKLGLVHGLRAERFKHDWCRCGNCSQVIRNGDWLVWVPDGVRRWDSKSDIEEICRLNAYNGSGTGWCLRCAPKKSRGGWRRLFGAQEKAR